MHCADPTVCMYFNIPNCYLRNHWYEFCVYISRVRFGQSTVYMHSARGRPRLCPRIIRTFCARSFLENLRACIPRARRTSQVSRRTSLRWPLPRRAGQEAEPCRDTSPRELWRQLLVSCCVGRITTLNSALLWDTRTHGRPIAAKDSRGVCFSAR